MSKNKDRLKSLIRPVMITVVLMIICGLLFPLLLTGLSALIFPKQAAGSLIEVDGEVVGSETVGQEFTEPYFMKGRPSAVHYNTYKEDENGNLVLSDGSEFSGVASGSANYGPTNPELVKRVEADIDKFLKNNPEVNKDEIPADLMTASGSGLDPHISVKSAMIQIPALSEASGLTETELVSIVQDNTKGKLLGIFGEETVNVLGVNLQIAQEMNII